MGLYSHVLYVSLHIFHLRMNNSDNQLNAAATKIGMTVLNYYFFLNLSRNAVDGQLGKSLSLMKQHQIYYHILKYPLESRQSMH